MEENIVGMLRFDKLGFFFSYCALSHTSFGMLGVYQSKKRAYQFLLLVVHFMVC